MSIPTPGYWAAEPGFKLSHRELAFRLIRLAETLESAGRSEEAKRVALSGLRAFVSLGEDNVRLTQEANEVYLSAIEFFLSDDSVSPTVHNSLIRLYSRLLHTKNPEGIDWMTAEHAILRSCVVHYLAGGAQSALADIVRKTKIWKYNQGFRQKRRTKTRTSAAIDEWTTEFMKDS